MTLTAPSGEVVYAPNWGGEFILFYLEKTRTFWWIIAPSGAQSIQMSFSQFNLISGYISMTLYACSNRQCRELSVFLGGKIPPCAIVQNAQEIRIRISTGEFSWYDFAIFRATYTSSTTVNGGQQLDGQCSSVREVFTAADKPFCHSGEGVSLARGAVVVFARRPVARPVASTATNRKISS